jgi:hypothetical protein
VLVDVAIICSTNGFNARPQALLDEVVASRAKHEKVLLPLPPLFQAAEALSGFRHYDIYQGIA